MKNPNIFLLVSVLLIVMAIALVAIIDRTSKQDASSDVRARASSALALKLTGLVSDIDETEGTITVENVQFAQDSRSGNAQNYGTWLVTPPVDFNYASVAPGTLVEIGVDSKTFQVTSHTMVALTLEAVQ